MINFFVEDSVLILIYVNEISSLLKKNIFEKNQIDIQMNG